MMRWSILRKAKKPRSSITASWILSLSATAGPIPCATRSCAPTPCFSATTSAHRPVTKATPEDVEATADCLYIGEMRFDPRHWYRMLHHFPVIDEDNYDRFAALVIADLNAGPLHESAGSGDGMLLVGEPNPLTMTAEARRRQKVRKISADALSPEGDQT